MTAINDVYTKVAVTPSLDEVYAEITATPSLNEVYAEIPVTPSLCVSIKASYVTHPQELNSV